MPEGRHIPAHKVIRVTLARGLPYLCSQIITVTLARGLPHPCSKGYQSNTCQRIAISLLTDYQSNTCQRVATSQLTDYQRTLARGLPHPSSQIIREHLPEGCHIPAHRLPRWFATSLLIGKNCHIPFHILFEVSSVKGLLRPCISDMVSSLLKEKVRYSSRALEQAYF